MEPDVDGTNHQFTDRDVSAVVQIYRRLDGLPLAIGLVAVRDDDPVAGELLERLDDRPA